MEKRATMKDIANEMGLSINAVSLALNDRVGVSEETRRRVLDTAERVGYLEKKTKFQPIYSSKNICVLLQQLYFHDMHFYGKVLMGLEESARQMGYDLFITAFGEDEAIPLCVKAKKVAGVIVVGKLEDDYLLRLKEEGIPVVLTDHTSMLEATDSVLTDNRLGAFQLTRYLLDKGFTEIGFFGGLEYSLSIRERYWGVLEALRTRIDCTASQLEQEIQRFSLLSDVETFIIENDCEGVIERIKTLPRLPQAFVCSNDKAAIMLCRALKALAVKVPGDVSVVGFDDIALSAMVTPALTTVHVYKELMGRRAMELMKKRLDCPGDKVEKVTLSIKLVERDSVKQ